MLDSARWSPSVSDGEFEATRHLLPRTRRSWLLILATLLGLTSMVVLGLLWPDRNPAAPVTVASETAGILEASPTPRRDLLGAVARSVPRWGASLREVQSRTRGTMRSSGQGECHDMAWNHLDVPLSTARVAAPLAVHAWVDTEVGFFEFDIFSDPRRQPLDRTVSDLRSLLGLGRELRSNRYSVPVYSWRRGAERLNTTLTTRAQASMTAGRQDAIIVRVFDVDRQRRASAHLHAACPSP